MPFSPSILSAAEAVLNAARKSNTGIITAESCTGGLISGALTAIAGSSDVVLGGITTYANEAKMELLGLPEALLVTKGAVSAEAALAMSEGAILAARHIAAPDRPVIAIAVTGVAGPGGGSAEKPVGTVHLAVRHYPSKQLAHAEEHFSGDRDAVRTQTVGKALAMLQEMLS